MSKHQLWCEKYRPTNINQYIFHSVAYKESFEKMIYDGSFPHLLLTGSAGTGKTTLARVLFNELKIDESDVLTINASDERDVDTIRNKIITFVSTYPNGAFKVVFLDEADYIPALNQGILRKVLEDFSDSARFILAGNYSSKFIPAIKSRCQEFVFKSIDPVRLLEYAVDILDGENIEFDLKILNSYIAVGKPDIRKIVNLLQQNSVNGVLRDSKELTDSSDYKFELLDLLEEDKWVDIRKLVCEHVAGEEWEDVYRFLYDNLDKTNKFKQQGKWDEGICIIAEHLFKHSLVADSEINAAAMFIRLGQI